MDKSTAARAEIECGLLALQMTSLTLAILRRELSLWLAFAIFAIFLEALGILNGTHTHEAFHIQGLVSFLPLKEMLWYPLNLYPAWISARILRKSRWGTAASMALMTQFSSIPYDYIGGCGDLKFWTMHPEFEMANLNACNGMAGISGINFSWLCSGLSLGLVLFEIEKRNLGLCSKICLISFSWIASPILWTPFHTLKAIGCIAMLDPSWYMFPSGVDELMNRHISCIKLSPVSDMHCWLLALSVTLITLWLSEGNYKVRITKDGIPNESSVVSTVIGYNSLLVFLTSKYKPENLPFIVFSSALTCAVYIFIHTRNWEKKSNCSTKKNC